MRIINELSHDIFNWIWRLRNENKEVDDMAVCEQIRNDLKQNSLVNGEIAEAIKSSYEYLIAS